MKKIFSLLALALIATSILIGINRPALAQWTEANGPYSSTIYGFTSAGTTLYAAYQKGVFVSSDNGANWVTYNNSLTNGNVTCLASSTDGTAVFAGTGYAGPYLSTDNGKTWIERFIGGTYSVSSLAVSGANVFAGTNNGAFVSSDNGVTWDTIGIALPANYRATCFAIGENVFVASAIGLVLSPNGGTTWSLVDTTTNLVGFAVAGTDLFAASGDVLRSMDNGKTWSVADSGLEINRFNGARVLAVSGNNLFAGTTSKGVFLSNDNGTTWTPMSSGLPNNGIPNNLAYTQIYSMTVTDSFVLVGFYQGGIWRLPLSQAVSSVEQLSSDKSYESFLAYPNPAHTSFSLNNLQGVNEVRIFDAAGREVLSQKVSGPHV
ncbi:MAG TPA: sialidase family protein, partial [Candidatus Kapabacteria bacterium]|nr:sialidase family protein [Candidatus Kapabacteria bacterium]